MPIKVGQIVVPDHLHLAIRETTNVEEWMELCDTFRLELQGRISATADVDLPKLKHQIAYIEELKTFFGNIFQKK